MAVDQAIELPVRLGDFRITGLLGEGGSGVVYAAQWGHRQVALKVLRADLLPTEGQRKRFLAEATLLAAVDHPGVVKVLGFGELPAPDGRPYLAMEKLDGEALAARLARGPLGRGEAFALFDQLAGAVAALHERGLVHRDLKPENVFVVGGYAVLLDFGIAKGGEVAASTVTQEGVVRGTPAYMAPERFFGAAASPATDLYELAVMLYAMLCGRLPWTDHQDPAGRLNPPRPSDLGVALPGELEVELMRALSTRPENRPASVTDFATRVRTLGDQPTLTTVRHTAALAPSPVPTEEGRGGGKPRRKRWPYVIAAATSALAIATVAFVVSRPSSTPSQPDPPPLPPPAARGEGDQSPPAPAPPATVPAGPSGPVPPEVWRYHGDDTAALVGLAFGQLRQSPIARDVLAQYAGSDTLRMLGLMSAVCRVDVLARLEWITLGAPATAGEAHIDLLAGGDWNRADLEDCIASAGKAYDSAVRLTRHGDATELRLPARSVWIGWPDDRTILVTVRPDADAAWVRRRVAGEKTALRNRALAALRKEIPTSATLWMLASGADQLAVTALPGVPPPQALWLGLWVADDLRAEVGLRYRSDAEAALAAKALGLELKKLKADPFAGFLLADATIEPRGTDVRMLAHLDAKTSRIVAKAVAEAFADQFSGLK